MVSTTIKLPDDHMNALREIAIKERRSVGFLIRDAISFWLAEHDRQEAIATGNVKIIQVPPRTHPAAAPSSEGISPIVNKSVTKPPEDKS